MTWSSKEMKDPQWVYTITQVSCTVFACKPVEERLYWNPDDTRDTWPLRAFPRNDNKPEDFGTLRYPDLTPGMTNLLHEMVEWREKRGHEDAKA